MDEEFLWKRRDAVLWRQVGDDVVLLVPEAAVPFTVAAGAALWDLLAVPVTAAGVAAVLAQRTGALAAVHDDVERVLAELSQRRAIVRVL